MDFLLFCFVFSLTQHPADDDTNYKLTVETLRDKLQQTDFELCQVTNDNVVNVCREDYWVSFINGGCSNGLLSSIGLHC
jgi:hypothetical protein